MAFYDEVFTPSGGPRPHTEALAGALTELGREQLADAGRRRDAIFMQQGITFDANGVVGTTPTVRSATARSRSTSSRA